MKFSENWLREWVDPSVDSDELCRQLTMAGLEVDGVERASSDLDRVVVGVIESTQPHPQADELVVCEVDCGAGDRRTIVCGAPNAQAGLRAPVALPGAYLPNDTEVEVADLLSVYSEGMLCSADELGLSDSADSLLALDPQAPAGTPITAHLALNDNIIEIDLTPNRGDCLSLRGVAREVGVWNRLPVAGPETDPVTPARDADLTVTVADPAACPTYVGRSIVGVNPDARTPDWLCERLRRSGIRPVFPVVDVTNYVMLELGQPMHAFDQQAIEGGITVRRADRGEQLRLLDETDVTLDPETLVIADDKGPVAMAGVMGGARTGVTSATVDVFLESACFSPLAMAGQGRRYKVQTDSLHRFERGVDPALQSWALARAAQLIQTIAGGEAGAVVGAGSDATQPECVRLRSDRLHRILGTTVPPDEVVDILERLEMVVAQTNDGWDVTPPHHRYDIALEADLIEEIARIRGYDQLPGQKRPAYSAFAIGRERQRPLRQVREILRQRGYDEAITYSFVDTTLQARLNPDADAIDLDNPIADNLAQMRTTLWASLIPCWQHNVRRQQQRVRMFEYGLRFERDESARFGIAQRRTLAGLVYGLAQPEHWAHSRRHLDFFDAKGDVQALFTASDSHIAFKPEVHPALHPGRCARVTVDDKPAGWVGQLHPDFAKTLGNSDLPYLFELDYEVARQSRVPRLQPISEFPRVRRDLAFSMHDSIPADALIEALCSADEPLLQHAEVFDVFSGGDLEDGFKSIALGLIFQDKTSTLSAEDVEHVAKRLIERVNVETGAVIRGQ